MNAQPFMIIDAAKERALRKARTNFEGFIRYTMPSYEWGWFTSYLCGVMQEFYEDYKAGKNPRLMLHAPPRAGKSEIASRRFPTWALGQDNTSFLMACSFGSSLANKMSRDCQRIITDRNYHEVFPDTCLSDGRKSSGMGDRAILTNEEWEIVDRNHRLTTGSYKAAGVGGGINGMGFDIGIIDDPVKDYKEASSPTVQASNMEWYDSTFYTRRNVKSSGIIQIMTRWHKKDLGGKIADRMKDGSRDGYHIESFPMEATKKEYIQLGGIKYQSREKGEILFPERMNKEYVEDCKTSALVWSALYQQNPTIAGGNFFKAEHWAYHTPEMLKNIVWKRKIITADTAQKKGTHNDYSVFQVWGQATDNRIYLLHQERGKWFSYELKAVAKQLWADYGGGTIGPKVGAHAFYIEDKVSGTGLIQELRMEGIPCNDVQRNAGDGKGMRAIDCHSYFASGLVVLPSHAPWLNDFLMEFEDFSLNDTHPHDDQVDPALDAVDILLKGQSGSVWS